MKFSLPVEAESKAQFFFFPLQISVFISLFSQCSEWMDLHRHVFYKDMRSTRTIKVNTKA